MRILFAAAEAAPVAKVGGMADVVGSLPPVLRQMGHDVRIVLPNYSFVLDKLTHPVEKVWEGSCMFQSFQILQTILPNTDVPLYLVNHPCFDTSHIYYGEDEDWRFTFFANAAAELAWNFWKPNIIHCHDWHTGMIPAWMHQTADIGTVFTIHNLAYQGPWLWRLQQITWVPWYMQARNAMESGIKYADRVNTVSPTYAQQICTPSHGEGLEDLLKVVRPKGILNGIDTKLYNPATDPALARNYSVENLEARLYNKTALQEELGLKINKQVFLIGMVTRLVEQKGLDLLLQILERFLAYSDVQFVVLGTGDRYYETQLWQIASKYSGRVSAQILYNASLSRRIYAGCDAFLMPSRFEPCGIAQMIAMRYGCVPIVRRTGGLVDTVQFHDPQTETGTGFCFDRYEPLDLYTCMVRAWESYRYTASWRKLQIRGMTQDFSWQKAAREYLEIYQSIMG